MTPEPPDVRIAHFSMGIAVVPRFPTYSGGLRVLAGDLRPAAGPGDPQRLFSPEPRRKRTQSEEPQEWNPENVLESLESVVSVFLAGTEVKVRGWRHLITGLTGDTVPVYFLDVDLPENSAWYRTLTDQLNGGDTAYRLCQEAILGIGGVRFLRATSHRNISRFHMNEGHSALLTTALLEEEIGRQNLTKASTADIDRVREKCVFTTHTPVPAAFDQFPLDLATRVLEPDPVRTFLDTQCCTDGTLNMTYLARRCSRYINGVAMRQGELSQSMFPNYPIHSTTNGAVLLTASGLCSDHAFHDCRERIFFQYPADGCPVLTRRLPSEWRGQPIRSRGRAYQPLGELAHRT